MQEEEGVVVVPVITTGGRLSMSHPHYYSIRYFSVFCAVVDEMFRLLLYLIRVVNVLVASATVFEEGDAK